MNQTETLRIVNHGVIGRLPVVLLPLNDYEKMREDLEMFQSKNMAKEIKKAREEAERGDVLDLAEARKKLRLS